MFNVQFSNLKSQISNLPDSISLKQSLNSRFTTTETLIECHGMFCSPFTQNLIAETLGSLLVEDTVALEYAEGIGIQYLSPFIGIIACSITAGHDVRELYGHTRIL